MSALNGINGTIFMYGQTGSGKTHTMLGDVGNDIKEKMSLQKIQSHARNNKTLSEFYLNDAKKNNAPNAPPTPSAATRNAAAMKRRNTVMLPNAAQFQNQLKNSQTTSRYSQKIITTQNAS